MTKSGTVAVVVGLIIIAGIAYAVSSGDSAMKQDDAMMPNKETVSGDAMMKQDEGMTTEGDAMMQKDDAMMKEEMGAKDAMMKKGSYETYSENKLSLANNGDVVLFFRATWCPTCKALDADIRSHMDAIPTDLTILDVNYDDSAALKKKYGVTYQHTFVQVAADGALIKKWSGSPTLAALVSEVQ